MKTKYIILSLFLLIFANNIYTQKYYNNWCFGQNASIDFNHLSDTIHNKSKMNAFEGSSSISDNNGNLLFYTDGITIWNKNHDTLENGFGLLGGVSSTQSALIVKQPGNSNLYYLFTSDHVNLNPLISNNGVFYSIVDINLNSGLGKVIEKNTFLFKNSSEKLTAVNHQNGQDVWIASIKYFSDSIYLYKLTENGISSPIIHKMNTNKIGYGDGTDWGRHVSYGIGQMKFSSNGKYLAFTEYRSHENDTDYSYIHFLDFNHSNGTFSNYRRIVLGLKSREFAYGCEFSPNEKFLYFTCDLNSDKGIYQIPIDSIKNNIDVNKIRLKINSNNYNQFYSLQLAPNRKIYATMGFVDSALSVINNPDSNGLKTDFEYRALKTYTNSTKTKVGLPNCVQSQIYYPIKIVTDTTCLSDSALIKIVNTDVTKIVWHFGDGNTKQTTEPYVKHLYAYYRIFNVSAIVSLPDGKDTIIYSSINIVSKQKPNLGNDTIICPNTKVLIKDQNNNLNIQFYWNTIDTTQQLYTDIPGEYILTYKHKFCNLADTIKISLGNVPNVFIGDDETFCNAFTKKLDAGIGFKNYKWNTEESTYSIMVDKEGLYHVKVTGSNHCEASDTINLNQIPPPKIEIIPDTTICDKVQLKITPITGIHYLWSNDDTGAITNVYSKGSYWVKAQYPFCYNSDTISVNKLPKPDIFIGKDTFLCNHQMLRAPFAQSYLWSNGSTQNSIIVTEPGVYFVRIQKNNCFNSDTIEFTPCLKLVEYIPNSFSPNNDGINDVFQPTISNAKSIKMSIFNRWGELIFEITNVQPFWDGNFKNQICQEGVYMYSLTIVDLQEKKHFKNGTISLLR
ncbi:MAG: gliding motility-associated C-terminal domain-containing protein [Bacteroidota bacterium]|nr:gliding motility-associated C-terminal domain-containing protein [Bacteroidota bacterium]